MPFFLCVFFLASSNSGDKCHWRRAQDIAIKIMKTPKTIIWVQIVSPENNLSFLGLGFDYDGEQDWTGKGKLEFVMEGKWTISLQTNLVLLRKVSCEAACALWHRVPSIYEKGVNLSIYL